MMVLTSGCLLGPPRAASVRALGESCGKVGLLGVELDDELLLHRSGDLPALGLAQHLRGQGVMVGLQPRGDLGGQLGGVTDECFDRGTGLDGDDIALAHLVARDVHAAAVDGPVAVADELARLAARAREAEADEDVVQARLKDRQQVLAGDALLARGLGVVDPKLLFEYAVVASRLLLLAQLDAVLGLLLASAPVVARRVRTTLDAALVGQAALTLEKELLAFAAALLAGWSGV